ncbi:TolC family protein [Oecophyllibacter saccharovorans]|uniref:TolC family protein n=1 Tax=Oecophyllibacter saccharovorans TaxID=2558360 RepID=UPI001141A896|nr:TolC family protein [Oecophyllibacter saccharovorans]QDH14881.1 TolC family protein [Oecophyllibacter saccharovorans]
MKARHLCGLPALLPAFLLAGCATSALRDAPASPDRPWQMHVDAKGRLALDGPSEGSSDNRGMQKPLTLPSGYRLPSARLPAMRTPLIPHADHAYSLPELIDIAQTTNPETRVAWNTARNVALASGISESIYLPQLAASVVGGYSHMKRTKQNMAFSNGRMGVNNDGELQSIAMTWLLFDFGKKQAVQKAVRLETLASDIGFTGAHQKVIYNVTLAYYLYAAAQEHIQLIARALDNARAIAQAAKANLQHGQASAIDVAQAEQEVAQMQLRKIQAEGATQNLYIGLLNAMGLPPTTQITLSLSEGHSPTRADIRLTEHMVEEAVARRPDVQAAYALARSAESRIEAARAEFRPKIFLSGNATYSVGQLGLTGLPGIGPNSSPSLNIGNSNFSGLILGGITVPIYDGGMRLAQLRQAQNNADSAREKLRMTRDNSVREIVVAQNGLTTGQSAFEAATALERTARTGYNAALTAYRSGEGTVTRLLEMQNGLFNATMSRSDSYYATLAAAATLAFATGSLGDAQAVTAATAPAETPAGLSMPPGAMPSPLAPPATGAVGTVPGLAFPPTPEAVSP